MPFFTFHQNNSGGVHTGPAIIVIIEAKDARHANFEAETHGLYFDGCNNGQDCPCCGDRWRDARNGEGDETPTIYGQTIEDYLNAERCWTKGYATKDIPHILKICEDGTQTTH